MRAFGISVAVVAGFFVLLALGVVMGWFGEAAQVTHDQFGPRALLVKYEWFKTASAELDKKRADIQLYERRIGAMEADYGGEKRRAWSREDREQMNVWRSEEAGVKASYNSLAAEYNAQMAKFNWAFANAGELPKGATEPLPREFKPYDTN